MTNTLQPTAGGEDIERMLTERDIEFRKVVISFDQIDKDASRHNQARFLPIHDDLVITYGAAMEQGDIFPPIVVNGSKGKNLVVLDGNHRVAAAELVGYKQTTAYVVTKISGAAAELFTFEANARHGMTTTLQERIQQGVYLVNMGNQPKAVARALAVPERKLYEALATTRANVRLSKVGIDPELIPASSRRRLDSLSSNVVLKPTAELAIKSNLNTEDLSALIVEINKAENETAALAVVAEARARLAPRIRSTSGGRLELPKNINRVLIAHRILKNLDTSTLPKEIDRLDEDMAKAVRRDLFQLIGTLVTASEALGNAG